VLLVVDASDPLDELRAKVETNLAELDRAEGTIVPVLNKADLVDESELAPRVEAAESLALAFESAVTDPVVVSATENRGFEELTRRVRGTLPTERAVLRMPNVGDAQSVISWAHDSGRVADVTYPGGGERVRVAFEARPEIAARARSKAEEVRSGE
jgi:GTP-binding protein HflX